MGYAVPVQDIQRRRLRPWAQVTWNGVKKVLLHASLYAGFGGLIFAVISLRRGDNLIEGLFFGLSTGFAIYLIMVAIAALLLVVYIVMLFLKSAIEWALFK